MTTKTTGTYQTITIQTRKGTEIENIQSSELTVLDWSEITTLPRRFNDRTLVHHLHQYADPAYNCHGLTFGSRRAQVGEIEGMISLHGILEEDGFRLLRPDERPQTGDVAIYYGVDGLIAHTGIVASIQEGTNNLWTAWVWSKWGKWCEVYHNVNAHPYKNITSIRYWRMKSCPQTSPFQI